MRTNDERLVIYGKLMDKDRYNVLDLRYSVRHNLQARKAHCCYINNQLVLYFAVANLNEIEPIRNALQKSSTCCIERFMVANL